MYVINVYLKIFFGADFLLKSQVHVFMPTIYVDEADLCIHTCMSVLVMI